MAFVTSEYSIKSLFWLEKWTRTQKQAEFGQKRDQFRWAGIDLGVSQKNVRLGYFKLTPLTVSLTVKYPFFMTPLTVQQSHVNCWWVLNTLISQPIRFEDVCFFCRFYGHWDYTSLFIKIRNAINEVLKAETLCNTNTSLTNNCPRVETAPSSDFEQE